MTEQSETMVDDYPRSEKRVGRFLVRLLVAAIILVLVAGVLYLLAERNSRRYFLVVEENHLIVQRGIFFPVGERRYSPEDPDFQAAYRPIPIPAGEEPEPRFAFDERAELDRVLVGKLLEWSRDRIDIDQLERIEEGIYYLRRAEKLPTTTAAQRQEMDMLRGEVAYHEGRRFIESALRSLDTARERLTQARDSPAGWGRESRLLLQAIQEPEEALRKALRDEDLMPDPEEQPQLDEPEAESLDEDEPIEDAADLAIDLAPEDLMLEDEDRQLVEEEQQGDDE